MGVSVGGGIGPVRVSTNVSGRRSSTPSGGSNSGGLVFVILLVAVVTPYWFGTWVASLYHASAHTRNVVGWSFLAFSVVFCITALAAMIKMGSRIGEEEAQAKTSTAMVEARQVVNAMLTYPLGRPGSDSSGEVIIADFGNVTLVEPRNESPTFIDKGWVTVTGDTVRYRSATNSVMWKLDQMLSVRITGNWLSIPVSSRKRVSGISAPDPILYALAASIMWARQVRRGETDNELIREALIKALDDIDILQ